MHALDVHRRARPGAKGDADDGAIQPGAHLTRRGIVVVDDEWSARLEHAEEARLRADVVLRRRMELEMLVGHDVREQAKVVLEPFDTLEKNRVRRHLHDGGAGALGREVAQRAVNRGSLGRRHPRLDDVTLEANAERADDADLLARGTDDRLEEQRGGCLPERAGDSDHAKVARGMPVELARQLGERLTRIGHDERRRAVPGAHGAHRDRAAREGVGDEARSVGIRAGDRDKELTRLHLAGVERNARDLPVRPRKRESERAGERAQAHR